MLSNERYLKILKSIRLNLLSKFFNYIIKVHIKLFMKKKSLNYSNLSKKELEYLKDQYVIAKLKSMNIEQLKDFVHDNISHQIKDTIGHEEEMEAWLEMENFFNDDFELLIQNIQNQFSSKTESEIDADKIRKENNLFEIMSESEKIDMWED